MGLYAKPKEEQELLSFLSGGGSKTLGVVLQCIFGRDFYSRILQYRKLSQCLFVMHVNSKNGQHNHKAIHRIAEKFGGN